MTTRRSVVPPEAQVVIRDEPGESPTVVRELLGFTLAEEQYGLPLQTVREILKPPPLTEVPRAPADVLGIVAVRGRVITVIDLRRRLRMAERPFGKLTRILLVEEGDEILGLLVDRVLQVFRLREDEVELAAAVGGDTAEYVFGIGRPESLRGGRFHRASAANLTQDELLILLDPRVLLKR